MINYNNLFVNRKYNVDRSFTVDGFNVDSPSMYKGYAFSTNIPVSSKKANRFIDNENIRISHLFPGYTLLNITFFEFISSPVGPYSEVVYSLPVTEITDLNIPFINIALKKNGYYVIDIQQSTKIAIKHGNLLTGYPHNKEIIHSDFMNKPNDLNIKITQSNNILISIIGKIGTKCKIIHTIYKTFFSNQGILNKIRMDIHGIERSCTSVKMNYLKSGTSKLDELLPSYFFPIHSIYYPIVVEVNPVSKKIYE